MNAESFFGTERVAFDMEDGKIGVTVWSGSQVKVAPDNPPPNYDMAWPQWNAYFENIMDDLDGSEWLLSLLQSAPKLSVHKAKADRHDPAYGAERDVESALLVANKGVIDAFVEPEHCTLKRAMSKQYEEINIVHVGTKEQIEKRKDKLASFKAKVRTYASVPVNYYVFDKYSHIPQQWFCYYNRDFVLKDHDVWGCQIEFNPYVGCSLPLKEMSYRVGHNSIVGNYYRKYKPVPYEYWIRGRHKRTKPLYRIHGYDFIKSLGREKEMSGCPSLFNVVTSKPISETVVPISDNTLYSVCPHRFRIPIATDTFRYSTGVTMLGISFFQRDGIRVLCDIVTPQMEVTYRQWWLQQLVSLIPGSRLHKPEDIAYNYMYASTIAGVYLRSRISNPVTRSTHDGFRVTTVPISTQWELISGKWYLAQYYNCDKKTASLVVDAQEKDGKYCDMAGKELNLTRVPYRVEHPTQEGDGLKIRFLIPNKDGKTYIPSQEPGREKFQLKGTYWEEFTGPSHIPADNLTGVYTGVEFVLPGKVTFLYTRDISGNPFNINKFNGDKAPYGAPFNGTHILVRTPTLGERNNDGPIYDLLTNRLTMDQVWKSKFASFDYYGNMIDLDAQPAYTYTVDDPVKVDNCYN